MHYLPLTSQLLRAKKKKTHNRNTNARVSAIQTDTQFYPHLKKTKMVAEEKKKKKKKKRNTRILEDGPGGCPLPIYL